MAIGPFIIYALAAGAITTDNTNRTDYCEPDLCIIGDELYPHIACDNSGKWSGNCSTDAKLIPIEGTDLEILLLDLHNDYRNQLANGSVSPFPSATRMTTQQWNSELAYVAELNAKRCLFEHDECRNTAAFPYSGQNLAYFDSFGFPDFDNEYVIRHMVAMLFDEYVDAEIEDIRNVSRVYRGDKQIGHFLMLAQDRANYVGCAMSQYQNGEWRRRNLVCNYSYNNIFTTPVYAEGEACSECEMGCNEDYPALCNATEVVPNKCDFCY